MNTKIKYNNKILFLLLVGSGLLVCIYFFPRLFSNKSENIQAFQKELINKEALTNDYLNLFESLDKENNLNQLLNDKKLVEEGIALYKLVNNKIIFWTNNLYAFDSEIPYDKPVIKTKNGWFRILKKETPSAVYMALMLIKKEFEISNKNLENEFHPSYKLPDFYTIEFGKSTDKNAIFSTDNTYLFSLVANPTIKKIPENNLLVILFFIGYFLLLMGIYHLFQFNSTTSFFLGIITIIACYAFVNFIYIPTSSLFDELIFNPSIFAHSSLIPSLGALITCFIALIVFIQFFVKYIKQNNSTLFSALGIGLTGLLSPIISDLFTSLIKNSTLNFDINYLQDINFYGLVGMLFFIMVFIFLFRLLYYSLIFSNLSLFKKSLLFFLPLLITTILIGIPFLFIFWVVPVFIILSINKLKRWLKISLVLVFIIFGLSYYLMFLNNIKTNEYQEYIADKLAIEKDPVTEYLFQNIYKKIQADSLIINNLNTYWSNKEKTDAYIKKKYFGGYWNKYDINIITTCNENDTILIQPEEINVNCYDFFNKKIKNESQWELFPDKTFYFLISETGVNSYFATIPFFVNNLTTYLYIEFFPKTFSKAEGYPELLLNSNEISTLNFNKYSFAKYKKGKLVNSNGAYKYPLELPASFNKQNPWFFINQKDYHHYVENQNYNTTIIVSTPQNSPLNILTIFSYLFILVTTLYVLIGFFLDTDLFDIHLILSSFSTKIQLFIIASIFIAYVLFGIGTSYYIKKQYEHKNIKNVEEKVNSVLLELEQKIGDKKTLNPYMFDELTYYLIKFSNVFYIDINLYDLNGKQLASSRPEVFEKGLISNYMNPVAFYEMSENKSSFYTQEESIGNLKFLSTYVPFRNNNNKILAYLNLPYFAKQNEFEQEISSFYTALINIYVLLFLISTLIAFAFANYLSEPVRMLRNKLKELQLGKSYEQLNWESNDEIGSLIKEYNNKVIELQKSAELLAKTERESAWREMAKQVAHEIKNPLTPMKLSIQHLQHAISDNPEENKQKINKTANLLIEQIDTLTHIANEFSNFAKMPTPKMETIDVVPIIKGIIELFQEENIKLTFHSEVDNAEVLFDKDQFKRVMNNLVKNAIQAIPAKQEGKINVTLKLKNNHILIAVEDNGKGIPEELKEKIFVPNFTTKSSGMGLGLAMVKNIVNDAHGKIWFESTENKGSIFYIELPVIK